MDIKGINKENIEKQEDGKLPWLVKKDGWVFEIDENGEVKAKKGISIPSSLRLTEGTSKDITAELLEGTTGTIEWQIEDTSTATINPRTGDSTKITAIKGGKTKLKVTVNGGSCESECEITVLSKVTEITVKDLEVIKGKTSKLEVETKPEGIETEELVYISSDENIATVDKNGNVTGKAEGEVTITVKGSVSTDVITSCTVTVK